VQNGVATVKERAFTLVRPMFVFSKVPGNIAAGTSFTDGGQKVQLQHATGSMEVFVYLDGAGTLAEPLSVAGVNSNEGYQILRPTFQNVSDV
jgi:hypothetical protein